LSLLGALAPGLELRLATRADNPAILTFLGQRAMRAGLALRFDRSPDFFALLDAHSQHHETWLLLQRERVLGMGSIVTRLGYIDGAAEPVAYVGELRVSPRRTAAGLWRTLLRERAAALRAELGVRYGFCCIIRGNRLARASVLSSHGEGLRFSHLRGYSSVAILARKPWARRTGTGLTVRRAGEADAGPLRAFLDEHSRWQPFGVVFDDATWQHRLRRWPGFGIKSFYLAADAAGTILGCLAPWDKTAIARTVIESMPRSLNLLRLVYNGLAPLARKPVIRIGGGACLPDIVLTHVCVANRDPSVFAALLDAAYREAAATGRYATLSLCLFDADPLAAALERYWHYRVPMDVYWLALDPAASSLPASAGRIPGFEMCLV
jgi:hypothetical protein